MKTRRPRSVSLLAALVLIFAGLYLARLVQVLLLWDFLEGLRLLAPPAYLAVSGLFWGVAALGLVWGLWRGKSWAPRMAYWGLLAFSIYFWLDRLLLPGYTFRNENWPFSAVANLLAMVLVWWILTRPKARIFFGEENEYKSQEPTTA